MTDSRSGYDEQLPWLEAVDDEDGPRGVPARRMLGALLVVLLAVILVSGTFFWLGRQNVGEAGGVPQLIKAPPGPYKVRPPNPGGLDVAGESQTAFETSAGEDPDSALDMNKLPQGVEAPPPEPAPGAVAKPEPKKVEPKAPPPPAVDGAGAGPTIQLGAYASTIKADTAWTMLSSRFPQVASLNKSVVSATVNGKSVYRLRAAGSADQTREACAALRAAGESCLAIK